MKSIGFEIRYFRSIGDEAIVLNPLKKMNVLVGQNNSGKSNVIRGIKKISDWANNQKPKMDLLDLYQRDNNQPLTFKIYFYPDETSEEEQFFIYRGMDHIWFEVIWGTQPIIITDSIFANITDFRMANQMLDHLSHRQWRSPVSTDVIRKEFINEGTNHLNRFIKNLPPVEIIPEFRQIRQGNQYQFDGMNLIELLGNYQMPEIGKDLDQEKFEMIQEFLRKLLHMPKALLEVTKQNSELIIKNDGLRLPLKSFGTGVHELIILITATLSMENSICCIEEPEIHLHPRLQRELMNFLLHETSNTYIVSTHSAALINSPDFEQDTQVVHLELIEGVTRGQTLTNYSQLILTVQDLGLRPSDLIQSNCIIWVEGPSDRTYIKRWLELVAPDLIEGRDFMFFYFAQYPRLNFENFAGELINVLRINRNAIFITDSDRTSKNEPIKQTKTDLFENCEKVGGLGWITDGREIENYITPQVIQRFFLEIRQVEVVAHFEPYKKFGDTLDRIAKSSHVPLIHYEKCKKDYSQKIVQFFTLDDIQDNLREKLDLVISKIRLWNQ